jgi:hypothetical protein
MSDARERNILRAERTYFRQCGIFMERIYYGLYRLRLICRAIKHRDSKRLKMLVDVILR